MGCCSVAADMFVFWCRLALLWDMQALRLDYLVQKVRPILTKLMSAGTGPQRGLFNVPVDPVKLGIPDYFKRVPNPMDLVSTAGVKRRETCSQRQCSGGHGSRVALERLILGLISTSSKIHELIGQSGWISPYKDITKDATQCSKG